MTDGVVQLLFIFRKRSFCVCHHSTNASSAMDAKEKVLDVLKKSDQPLTAGQITEISGLDRKAVDKAMKSLKDEERIVSPKRCCWEAKK
jgi:hypothetical protein